MAPTEPVDSPRVKTVTIDEYDQVFALTQYMINIGLKNKWITAKKNKDSAFAKPLDLDEMLGTLDGGIVGYPRIVVKTGLVETLTGASYMICFDGGKLDINYPIYGNPATPKKRTGNGTKTFENIAGWKLAFHLQLGMDKVERESDEFKETVGTTINPSDYSLNSLVAKFDTAVFKWDECEFPKDVDWRSLPPAVEENFKLFVTQIKQELLDSMKETRTLGYALKSLKKANEVKLNFEPHRIQYMTYPWLDPDAYEPKVTSGLNGNSRLNYFLYAETTGQRELPDSRFLKWKGNFTDGRIQQDTNPESGDFGSFMMARRNFFDGYLLKKLQKLNKVFEPTINTVSAKADDWQNPWYRWDCDLRFGERNVDEMADHYKFVEQSPTSWKFESSCRPNQAFDQVGNGGWSAKLWCDASCNSKTTVSFEPGTDIISVAGQSEVEFTMKWEDYHTFTKDISWTHRRKWQTIWSMTLDLEAVGDGGLQILCTWGDVQTVPTKDGIEGLKDYDAYAQAAIEAATTRLTGLQKSLAEDLADQRGLVLPASGIFYFKNPILGHNGDLICNLSYDETASKTFFDEKPNVNQGAKSREDITVTAGTDAPEAVAEQKFKEKGV